MKLKPGQNLPVSPTAILASAGHDAETVTHQGLTGAPDPDVVTAATAAGPILTAPDLRPGDIRAYPPASHAGIVVLRLTGQSAAAAIKVSQRPGHPGRVEVVAGCAASRPAPAGRRRLARV